LKTVLDVSPKTLLKVASSQTLVDSSGFKGMVFFKDILKKIKKKVGFFKTELFY